MWTNLDQALGRRGPYLLGERCSAADIYMHMLYTWYEPPGSLATRSCQPEALHGPGRGAPGGEAHAAAERHGLNAAMPVRTPSDVLEFWFSEQSRALWFEKNAAFDEAIRARFEDTVRAAAAGELDHWERTAPGALALVIVLDQFPRNLYRGSARAFAADPRAREVADRAIGRRLDQDIPLAQRHFFFLPFEHSESRGGPGALHRPVPGLGRGP